METKLLIDEPGFVVSGRMQLPSGKLPKAQCPLIVAIHGGGFTASYFDLPGYSLLEKAAARGCGVIGLDRMGYGDSRTEGRDEQSLANNRAFIVEAIGRLWPRFADSCAGVVLIGHSIGAALSMMVAAEPQDWPLLGVAVSGAALAENPALSAYFGTLPPIPWLNSGGADKDRLMLGTEGSYDPAVTELLHPAYRPVATRELAEIYSVWSGDFIKTITVPLHFRMGEADPLWVVDDAMIAAVSAMQANPASSAAIVRGAGHAIDFHKVGAAFHDEQLAFALRCVA